MRVSPWSFSVSLAEDGDAAFHIFPPLEGTLDQENIPGSRVPETEQVLLVASVSLGSIEDMRVGRAVDAVRP